MGVRTSGLDIAINAKRDVATHKIAAAFRMGTGTARRIKAEIAA
jgi:hypothetical protein